METIKKELAGGMDRPRIGKLSWPHAEMRIGNMRVQVSVHERATDDDGVDFWGTGKADGQAACVRWAERCRRFADELHALLEQYQDQDGGVARLDDKRANAMVNACVALAMESNGLPMDDREQFAVHLERARKATLSELVAANAAVCSDENKIRMHCDDRLTAAIYAALHYEPEIMVEGGVEPLISIRVGGRLRSLILVDTTEEMRKAAGGEWCQHCSPGADHCPVCGRGE